MDWLDLLFMHWPVPAEALRHLIPAGLELDLYQGQAWIAVVPFLMSGVRPRFLPELPGLSAFPELNVRTYVSRGSIPGVWFFSLDAANPLVVRGARRFFHLPYFDAGMKAARPAAPKRRAEGSGTDAIGTADPDAPGPGTEVRYTSRRTHSGTPPVELKVIYAPTGPAYRAAQGTLEDWLTARYCLYAADDEGGLFRCSIHHKPWRLQAARARIVRNTMTEPIGLTLPDAGPLLHFSERTEVVAWLPERLP